MFSNRVYFDWYIDPDTWVFIPTLLVEPVDFDDGCIQRSLTFALGSIRVGLIW